MPRYDASHEEVVPGPPERAFALLTDYERLPEWQGALERCTVLSRDAEGRGRDVEYEVDLRLRRIRYVLRHAYDPPHEIASEYLEGDFRRFEGHWSLRPSGDGTLARLELSIDPGMPVPGAVARMLRRRVLKTSVESLRDRLEEN